MACIISRQFTDINNHVPKNTKEFKNGCFSIKRTKNPSSRLPVDFTLKQAINPEVAGERIEISAIMNSISACQR